MKKATLSMLFMLTLSVLSAQNFQVHYDFGKNRNFVTTTFEMFKVDKLGNTFTFIDFDHNLDKEKHPSLAYMELARCFTIGKSPFSLQLEYNGGLLISGKSSGNPGYAINNAYLAGIDYGWHSADFTKFLNFKVLYKNVAGKNPASFQLTGVWNLDFFNKKMSVNGFADFWREDNMNYYNASGESIKPEETKFVFISEPQIWYNFTKNIAVGSEVEFGVNFGTYKGLKVCPTLGAKWTF